MRIIDFLSLNFGPFTKNFKMNRTDEVIEIEDFIATFFEDLNEDISFTSEEIDSFHRHLNRLEELDPIPRRNLIGVLIAPALFITCVIGVALFFMVK